MSTNPIADLAQWPATEDDVTVASMVRALLVWAKVYECRLVDAVEKHDVPAMISHAAVTTGMTMTGVLLDALAKHDPAAALNFAQLQWQIGDDGEVGSDTLIYALDEIDKDLAEQIVDAYEAVVKVETPTPASLAIPDLTDEERAAFAAAAEERS